MIVGVNKKDQHGDLSRKEGGKTLIGHQSDCRNMSHNQFG